MKKVLPLVYIFLLNFAFGQKKDDLTEISSFGKNPGNLKMFIHCNDSKGLKNKPLVVVLHGCSENAQSIAELSGWNKLADLNDFVVLYPQQKASNNVDLCFNWFKEDDINKNHGECESIFEMITYSVKHYSIDTASIYITGLSAGGAMSVVMMVTYPDLFRSGAIFAGGAYKIATNVLEATKTMLGKTSINKEALIKNVRKQNPGFKGSYPSMIIYQGKNDLVVNYKNAAILIEQWTGINNCDTIADKIESSYLGINDITRREYVDQKGNTIIIFYDINNLGHKLMIKPGENKNEGGQIGIYGTDKGYHSTFQTAKDFGIIK